MSSSNLHSRQRRTHDQKKDETTESAQNREKTQTKSKEPETVAPSKKKELESDLESVESDNSEQNKENVEQKYDVNQKKPPTKKESRSETDSEKPSQTVKSKPRTKLPEEDNVQRAPRLIKGRTVQFKEKKKDPWRVGWVVDIDESSVCVRYADKEKKGKYDEVWIDIDSGKIELFSRSEHKRNVVDVTGEFEKFNID